MFICRLELMTTSRFSRARRVRPRPAVRVFAWIIAFVILIAWSADGSFAAGKKARRIALDRPVSTSVSVPVVDGERLAPSAQDFSKKLFERLQKIVHGSGFKSGELGLWVGGRTDEGIATYFGQNPDRPFIPASLSKLVTLGAVLHELHPGYKYKTELVSDAPIKDGVLAGPLYLKGGGDPSFVSENMWFLVNELLRSGVTSVEGDVVVDDTRFDAIRYGDDRQKERVDRAYDAPVGAMSMNWNSVSVYVRPGDKVGDQLKVFVDVNSPYVKLRNETKTVAAGRGKNLSVERVGGAGVNGVLASAKKKDTSASANATGPAADATRSVDVIGAAEEIVVSGSMALGHEEAVFYKSITAPDVFSGYNLIEFLKQRGIAVKGGIRVGAAPASAVVFAKAESKPLGAVVGDMAKWSNNYVAEMLVKNLAAESGRIPGTMAAGMERVRAYMEEAGFRKGEYEFVNAAGFTRENQLSPAQIGQFLQFVQGDFTSFPEYLSSLPIGGVDGTLKNRMKGSAAERWVRAKTGLLNGVVGLAGYAGRSGGRIVTFAFIYNGGGREDRARALFDRLAAAIVED